MATRAPSSNGSGTRQGSEEATGYRDPLAPALGVASLGLGVPQITAPGRFAEAIGIRADSNSRLWTRVVGVRELAAAAGILAVERPRPKNFLWARVAGDIMDLALLARALPGKSERKARTLGAMGAVVGIMGADVLAAVSETRASKKQIGQHGPHVKAAVTVRKPREEIYSAWHDFQNLPRFMAHVESIVPKGDGGLHWKATGPLGRTVEWDAEVVRDEPGELIAWRSLPGSDVDNEGVVRFTPAPGERGTEVHLDMEYSAPGGPVGETVALLFGEAPEQQVRDDLRRFKQVMEAGVVVRSDGSPEGPLARRLMKQRPAYPPPSGDGAEGSDS